MEGGGRVEGKEGIVNVERQFLVCMQSHDHAQYDQETISIFPYQDC